MKRREFIAGLGGAAVLPVAARAQQRTMPIIAWLDVGSEGPPREFVEEFHRGLAEVGLSVGRDVTVDDIISLGTILAPLPLCLRQSLRAVPFGHPSGAHSGIGGSYAGLASIQGLAPGGIAATCTVCPPTSKASLD
jgi:hypothetical protein